MGTNEREAGEQVSIDLHDTTSSRPRSASNEKLFDADDIAMAHTDRSRERERESLPAPAAASAPAQRPSYKFGAAAIIPVWIVLSSAVIIYNNHLYNNLNFKFPVFLVTWHLTFAVRPSISS